MIPPLRLAPHRAHTLLAAAALLPLWRAGWMMPGFFRTDSAMPLSDGAPNLWALVQLLPLAAPLNGLAMAAAIGVASTLGAHWIARPPRPGQTVAAALLVALVLPGLLPGMRWSDFLPAAPCGIALLARHADPANRRIAALALIGLTLAATGLVAPGAIAMIAATIMLSRQFLVSPANDNGLPLNPFRVYPA